MTTGIDTPTVNHLGAVVAKLREHCAGPPWDTAGIRAALERALGERQPYPKVVAVATAAAVDPTAKTPAAIVGRLRNGWSAPREDTTPGPPRRDDIICRRCNRPKPEGDAEHAQHCGPNAQPGARERAFADRATHTDTEEDTP